ncbi:MULTISPECIES: helix-turn-helix domain-containing protein [Streptomyces]|uniref:helix-turn-helix domain-containing protein n=1 Tax=Streptomyces TaxID=1883 RepID=UPI001E61983E|nr:MULTISPECIES: helix-turn-helix domain-containing protein [Streptomyces]UFQ18246.1 helix-turn-helix domain-containing protein [Streptomyces huasconensis]WCL87859.1 helix-turn-helix domain-containing protein [Streptomyces sp. JCM 35825]
MAIRKDMRKVTDAELAEIIRLHGEGKGRNEIARLIGRAQPTASIVCSDEGLVFDVTMTEEATRHRAAQLADRRAMLAEALQDDAERLTAQLRAPARVYRIGGSSNFYTKCQVDELPADAKKDLMGAAGIAIAKSLKLVPPEREDTEGLAAVDQWLRGMIGGE